MTVHDLNTSELLELKSCYFLHLQATDNAGSFDDPSSIPDDVICEVYEGVLFTEDDFFCNQEVNSVAEQRKLFVAGKRSGYAPDQCGETMTVGQLRSALNNAVEWGELSDDVPIYLCNDNGYTYGEISRWNSFMIGSEYDNAEDFEIREYI